VDVIVVGGGSAGLQAALMLGRARRAVTVVDAGKPRNAAASAVHNVLGHEGIAPDELLARGRADAVGYGVEIVPGSVAEVGGMSRTGSSTPRTARDGGPGRSCSPPE
jgi:thioredoxin reductase (NADPH)